jgi:hypothetical protein
MYGGVTPNSGSDILWRISVDDGQFTYSLRRTGLAIKFFKGFDLESPIDVQNGFGGGRIINLNNKVQLSFKGSILFYHP